MFDRVQLKENAKRILANNYWFAVVIALILGFVGGGNSTGTVNTSNISDTISQNQASNYDNDDYWDEDEYWDDESWDDDSFFGNESEIFDSDKSVITGVVAGVAIVFIVVFLIVLILSFVLSAFVFGPIEVGCKRWMIKNRTTKPAMNEVVYVFSNGYMNVVKVMFLKNLYITLWSMLFIIPGVIKALEYRMIPYLLAENPYMPAKEAFERTRDMMHGNKFDAWVLDLSFIGWELLSAFTCGIVGVFYVNPYVALTSTELYVALCQTMGTAPTEGRYEKYDDVKDLHSVENYTPNPEGSSLRNEMFGNQNEDSSSSNDYSDQTGIDQDMFK